MDSSWSGSNTPGSSLLPQLDSRADQTSPTSSRPESKGRLIIGIDSGTTRCAVAFAVVPHPVDDIPISDYRQTRPDIENVIDWAGFNDNGDSSPLTILYYESLDKLPITGHALVSIFDNADPAALEVDHVVRLWKLLFHPADDPTTALIQERLQCQLKILGKTKQDIINEWVEVLYAELITEGPENLSKLRYRFDLNELDVEIVVPVPPGRAAIAHDQVRQAFIQGPIQNEQVSLVSEPEALFRCWVHEEKTHDWKLGTKYLVLDAGGGTGCLVRLRLIAVNPPQFEQEFESESIICGAETISNEFDKLSETKIALDCPNRKWVIDQMRRNFEKHKHNFGGSQRGIAMQRPGATKSEVINFSYEEIASCFRHCVVKLVEGIRRQLRRGGRVDYLILGGGLCHNGHVRKVLRDSFERLMTIRHLTASKNHVAKGAVLTRLHTPFIESRPVKLSKGVYTKLQKTMLVDWDKYHNLDIEPDRATGVEFVHVLQWLAKKGEQAEDIHELESEKFYEGARERTFPVSARTQARKFQDTIYSVDSYIPEDVKYTAFRRDGKLVDRLGVVLPDPVAQDTITWDPREMGVQIGGLQVRKRNGRSYRVLRYSIRMQLKEVGTKYWIKAWSLNNKRMDTAVPIDSKKLGCESIFDTHEISQNLSRSFELGSGVGNPPSHLPERFPNFIPQPQSSHEVQRRPSFSPLSPERPNEQLRPVGRQQLGSSAHPRPPSHAEGSHALQQQLKEGQVRPHAAASELSLPAGDANAVLARLGRKKTAPSEKARRHSRPSKIPLPRVAPRQSAETGIEPGEDVALQIGTCYSCRLRKKACSKELPVCKECLNLGLSCEWERPSWWGDSKLESIQREINTHLIYKNKRRKTGTVATRASNSFLPVNQQPGSSNSGPSQYQAQPIMAHRNSIVPPAQSQLGPSNFPYGHPVPRETRDESEDLYGASPPHEMHTRLSPIAQESARQNAPRRNLQRDEQPQSHSRTNADARYWVMGGSQEDERLRRSDTARSI